MGARGEYNGRIYTQREFDDAKRRASLEGELQVLLRMKEWRKTNNPRLWSEAPNGINGDRRDVYLDDRISELEKQLVVPVINVVVNGTEGR